MFKRAAKYFYSFIFLYACTCVCACVRVDVKDFNICKTSELEIGANTDIPKNIPINLGTVKLSKKMDLNLSEMIPDISDVGELKVVLTQNVFDSSDNSSLAVQGASMDFEYVDAFGTKHLENIGTYQRTNKDNAVKLVSQFEVDLVKLSKHEGGSIVVSMDVDASGLKSINMSHKICVSGSAHVEKDFVF